MKNLSATQIPILAFLFISLLFTSCKKGEQDPIISLKSRKGRLSGSWTASVYRGEKSSVENNVQPDGATLTSVETKIIISEGTLSETKSSKINGLNTTEEFLGTAAIEFSFEKDGSFSWIDYRKYDAYILNGRTFEMNKSTKLEVLGSWSFLHKNQSEDVKNKEQIALHFLSQTITEQDSGKVTTSKQSFSYGDLIQTWQLERLANKELNMFLSTTNHFNSGGEYSQIGEIQETLHVEASKK